MLPGMKQRIEIPNAPLIGQTIVPPTRFGNHGIIGNVDPLLIDADAVMAVLGFSVRIRKCKTIGISTARPLTGPEAVKPWLEWRLHIATIVACLHRSNKKCRDNAEGETQHRSFHDRVRSEPDRDAASIASRARRRSSNRIYLFFIGLDERQPALGRRHQPDRLWRRTRGTSEDIYAFRWR